MPSYAKKLLMLFALGVLVGLFFAFDLQRYLTLNEFKARQDSFAAYYAAHRLLS